MGEKGKGKQRAVPTWSGEIQESWHCRAVGPQPAPCQPHTIPTAAPPQPRAALCLPVRAPSRSTAWGRGTGHLELRVCSRGTGEPSLQGRSLQPVSCCCCGASTSGWCESPQPMLPLFPCSPLPTLAGASGAPLPAQLGSHNNPLGDPSTGSPSHGPWALQTRYPWAASASPRITGANSQGRPSVPSGLTKEHQGPQKVWGGPGKTPPTQLAAYWPKI